MLLLLNGLLMSVAMFSVYQRVVQIMNVKNKEDTSISQTDFLRHTFVVINKTKCKLDCR